MKMEQKFNFNDQDLYHYYKYQKYKTKYESLLNQKGGSNENDSKHRQKGEYLVTVKCVQVVQKNKTHSYDGRICKSPPIKMNFHEQNLKLSAIVKAYLRFVNKKMMMKYVTDVEIKQNKKSKKVKGDKLGEETIDIGKNNEIEEIVIKMN